VTEVIAPVSNSELGTFQHCRRQWYLKYVLGLALPEKEEPATGNMALGTRIHGAMEAAKKDPAGRSLLYWTGAIYAAASAARPEAMKEIEDEMALARVMLQGYEDWAAEQGIEEGIEVLEAESDVVADMPGMPGVQLRGRLDQMIRRERDGAVLFRDWKTCGSLDVANDLPLSPQMRFYVMLQRLRSGDVKAEGGQVVYLKRSKRTARAVPPFYALAEVRYSRHVLNATYLKTRSLITDMLRIRRELEAYDGHLELTPPSQQWSCSWSCPFFYLCPLMDDGSAWGAMAEQEFVRQSAYAYYDRDLLAEPQ
jgi:RecB family exonuclease